MARRSLKASPTGIEKVRKVVKDRDWTQAYLAAEVGLETRQPIWKFLTGRTVERHVFMEICFQLGLDWQEIAEQSTQSQQLAKNQIDTAIDALVQKVRLHRHDKIQAQCGSIRLLDIAQPIQIKDIYIDINVLGVLPCQSWIDISSLRAASEFNPLACQISQTQLPGLKAFLTYPKLLVLGKPGSGKTTFLQYIAVQCNQGALLPEQIPIFIRLKNLVQGTRKSIDSSLLSYIRQELCSSTLPNGSSDQEVEALLHAGKVLLLLDGLDELPAPDNNAIQQQIRQFSEEYYDQPVDYHLSNSCPAIPVSRLR